MHVEMNGALAQIVLVQIEDVPQSGADNGEPRAVSYSGGGNAASASTMRFIWRASSPSSSRRLADFVGLPRGRASRKEPMMPVRGSSEFMGDARDELSKSRQFFRAHHCRRSFISPKVMRGPMRDFKPPFRASARAGNLGAGDVEASHVRTRQEISGISMISSRRKFGRNYCRTASPLRIAASPNPARDNRSAVAFPPPLRA